MKYGLFRPGKQSRRRKPQLPVATAVKEVKDPLEEAIAGYERRIKEIQEESLPKAIAEGREDIVPMQEKMLAEAIAGRDRLAKRLAARSAA